MLNNTEIFIVDAFTNLAFTGNPAAVVILNGSPEQQHDLWNAPAISAFKMQHIATEINLSETAFIQQIDANGWQIRWFTPNSEAPLCLHATLASYHILLQLGKANNSQEIIFHTKNPFNSQIIAQKIGEELFLTLRPYTKRQQPQIEVDYAQLNLQEDCRAFIEEIYEIENCLMLVFTNCAKIYEFIPNLSYISSLPYRALIITAQFTSQHLPTEILSKIELAIMREFGDSVALIDNFADAQNYVKSKTVDFISRYFAPKVMINEDPVCGSAHCRLAPYWGERLGKSTLLAYQASVRGGLVRCVTMGPDKLSIGGMAVTVVRGSLM